MIFLDAGAATPVTPPRGAAAAAADVSALAPLLRPGGSVAVMAPAAAWTSRTRSRSGPGA
jgi:hypothetical protein